MLRIMALFLGATALAYSPSAHAGIPGTCGMQFQVHVVDPLWSLEAKGSGTGAITCTDLNGQENSSPITITMDARGPGVGEYSLRGVAGDINVGSAEELEGDYVGAALQFFAANIQMGFTGKKTGLKFGVNLALNQSGLGLFVGGTSWKIRLAK